MPPLPGAAADGARCLKASGRRSSIRGEENNSVCGETMFVRASRRASRA